MPFGSQFALSLELTRIAPVGLVTTKAAEALMSLARNLQNSGSDIVIEEDLADVFGRCRISGSLASSFKTVILNHGKPTRIFDDMIALVDGPGPTVGRALQDSPYLATVIQTSLLLSTHEKHSLAESIRQTIEKSQEGAPPDHATRAPPSSSGILGVLKAIEEQTSAYNWSGHSLAVAEQLPHVIRHLAKQAIPPAILTGVLRMLPMVQSLPSDRLIYIEGSLGMCTLVVWAHHVLGLAVLIKTNDTKFGDVKLGGDREGDEQVIIDTHIKQSRTPSITLLDSTREELFQIRQTPDDAPLDSCFKIPTKGYGKAIMREECGMLPNSDERLRVSVIDDMSLVALAFAFIITKHLVRGPKQQSRWIVSSQLILDAARLLFDDSLTEQAVSEYISIYSSRPLDHTLAPPASVVSYIRSSSQFIAQTSLNVAEEHKTRMWTLLVRTARVLSVVIIALAHVRNFRSCENLPLAATYCMELLGNHSLHINLGTWNGTESVTVNEDTWLNTIAILLTGHRFGADVYDMYEDTAGNDKQPLFNQACLVSDRGWSLYIPTFGTSDPSLVDRDFISISKGVPVRNGVWKRQIVDGPSQFLSTQTSDWVLNAGPGGTGELRCSNNVYFQPSLCGDREDTFVVTVRLVDQVGDHALVRRTGYRELNGALSLLNKSESCTHRSQKGDKIVLSPGCSTVEGFGDFSERDGKVTICLTAYDRAARWRAIIATACLENVQVLLRGATCCFSCAVDQVARQPGKWFLIL